MGIRWLAWVIAGWLVLAAAAQQERYREREVLDPESGQWVARPAPPPSTPVGALDQARELLARGEYKAVRKLLAEWTEQNPDHERYYEAELLLGDAEFGREHYYQAYEHYELVAENTGGELFYKVLRRELEVARAFLAGEKRIVWKFLRLPAYDDGIEILDRIWERVPGTRLGELALKLKADYYFTHGEMDLAQDEYANLVREHPYGRYTKLAMLRAAEAAEAAFPGIKFDDRALLDAEVRYRQLESQFPAYAEQEHVAERLAGIRQLRAEKDLYVARWYQKTGRPDAAAFYYRLIVKDWPETLAAREARAALRELGYGLEDESAGEESALDEASPDESSDNQAAEDQP